MSFIELDLYKIMVAIRLPGVEMGEKYFQRQTSFPGSLDPFTIRRLTDPPGLSREVPEGGA